MKKTISILPDDALTNKDYGCKINGELHVGPELYNRIYNHSRIDYDVLMNLKVIDVDELVYMDNLDQMIIFAGQQVKVFKEGEYIGDAVITAYPSNEHFGQAEVMMHFPFSGISMICSINALVPILRK